jgi:hypothetical protein
LHYDNATLFDEKVDMEVYANDSLILIDTLEATHISDNFSGKIVVLKKGTYNLHVKSNMQNVEQTRKVILDRDTDIIVEYQHEYDTDSFNLVPGKKSFMIYPMSFRHK